MIIAQFDTDPVLKNIMNRHLAWYSHHEGSHDFPKRTTRRGMLNSGIDFLMFHKNIQSDFLVYAS